MRPVLPTRRTLLRLSLASTLPPSVGTSRSSFTETYVQGDGVRLFVVHAGAGPLMLFLHGAPDDWTLYDHQLREFSPDHQVVAPNLRGYPPSDQPEAVEAYAMPRLLGDVHALLDHFGREACILVGNDWGGYLAWVFASAYPQRVERLIILNAPHPAVHLREVNNNPEQNAASQYERKYNAASAPYPAWYNYYRADPIKTPPSVYQPGDLQIPDLAARFFDGVALPPATTTLRVSVPTLVLWGLRDPSLRPGQIDHLDDYVSKVTIVTIDDAGHYPMRSHPELVNRAIRLFMPGSRGVTP